MKNCRRRLRHDLVGVSRGKYPVVGRVLKQAIFQKYLVDHAPYLPEDSLYWS